MILSKSQEKERKKMGDLHSIAHYGNLHSSSLGWDYFHNNLGLLNTDFSHYTESNSTPPFYSSPASDISTGYLEDALFEFSSKRRRMLLFTGHDQTDQSTYDYNNTIWNNWNPNCNEDISYDFKLDDLSHQYCVDNVASKCSIDSGGINEEEKNMKKIETGEETNIDSSQSKNSVSNKCISDKESPPYSYAADADERNKKRICTRVVYPFAMVKSGGFEGDTTLNDINKRILMPPTRSIKHPVGDFACRPLVLPDGPGLSGKEVVALTRIQTQGRGTITIIRTKG